MKIKCIVVAKISDTIILFLEQFIDDLISWGASVKILSGEGKYYKEITDRHVMLEPVEFSPTFNPFKALKLYKRTKHVIKRENPDVIICNDPSASFITKFAARRIENVQLIYFCHGLPYAPHSGLLKKGVYYFLERISSQKRYYAITMNEYDYRQCSRMYNKAFKINGVGVDVSQYRVANKHEKKRLREKYDIKEGSRVIAFIGRLIHQKGIKYFNQAAERLLKRDTKYVFLIVGEGPLRERFEKDVINKNMEKNIIFTGYIKETADIYSAIDMLVLPTYYTEGLPRVILEAMASGVPVIATNIRGCKDIIEHNKDGVLVPINDVDELLNAIEKISSNSLFREALINNALVKVRNNYAKEVVNKQFKDVIDRIGIFHEVVKK